MVYDPNIVPFNREDWQRYLQDELRAIADELRVDDWTYIGDTGAPPFTGTINWANLATAGQPDAAFYKDPFNRVHLKGAIDTGTNGESAFTLPEGYRPSDDLYFPVLQSAGAAGAYALIGTDGTVTITHSGATGSKDVHLNNISFRV